MDKKGLTLLFSGKELESAVWALWSEKTLMDESQRELQRLHILYFSLSKNKKESIIWETLILVFTTKQLQSTKLLDFDEI